MRHRSVATALCLVFASGGGAVGALEYPVRQLTNDLVQEGFPCWSPDGARIVFSRTPQDPDSPLMGLWLISPLGGEPDQLTRVIGEHPDWSPDGSLIVFDGDYGRCLQVVAAAGGEPLRLQPPAVALTKGGKPKWSPDGHAIAFRADDTLWIYEPATGGLTAAFREEGSLPIPGCWSRDGRSLIIVLRELESPRSAIWLIGADGEGGLPLLAEPDAVLRSPALSPDGKLLAFVRCEGRNCDLWVMPATGGDRSVQLTADAASDDAPSWSPDGGTIAFASDRGGSDDIWLVELNVPEIEAALAAQ